MSGTSWLGGNGMLRRPMRVGLSVALAATTLSLAATAAEAASPTPYNVNLLKNGGAEAGASTIGYSAVRIPGWLKTGKFTVVKYGTPDFPSVNASARFGGGKQFFTTGPNCDVASQSIKLRGRNSAIDSGQFRITVIGYIATYGNQPDTARVRLYLLDSTGHTLASAYTEASATDNQFRQFFIDTHLFPHGVPAGTRKLVVYLSSTNTVGYCDAYFDRLELRISAA